MPSFNMSEVLTAHVRLLCLRLCRICRTSVVCGIYKRSQHMNFQRQYASLDTLKFEPLLAKLREFNATVAPESVLTEAHFLMLLRCFAHFNARFG